MVTTIPLLSPARFTDFDGPADTDVQTQVLDRPVRSPVREEVLGGLPGHYHLDSLLGRGGMSEVYLGYDTRTAEPTEVAVKRVNSQLSGERQARARDALVQEGRTLTQLSQIPGVIKLLERYQDALVIEYVAGRPLNHLIQRAPRDRADLVQRCKYLAQTSATLSTIHRNGIVHRDVKPDNILAKADKSVVVIDFGIAIPEHSTESAGSCPDSVNGTPSYCAPEQLNGAAPHSSADVYSLGVTLYESMTGLLPRPGRTVRAIYMQSAKIKRPYSTYGTNQLSDLAMSALELQAEDRPTTDEFARDLAKETEHITRQ